MFASLRLTLSTLRTTLIATACAALGLAAGYFIGRASLERQWSQPFVLTSRAQMSSGAEANPVPQDGARLLRPMPLARARQVMQTFTQTDPLVMTVGAVGNGDEGAELHLVLQHRPGKLPCDINTYSGVAYGFDAWGRPAAMNQKGENFVAFSGTQVALKEGDKQLHSSPLKHVETASLAVAQIDQVTCATGERWARSARN